MKKRAITPTNCKHVQHVKIYLPCNFEVNSMEITPKWVMEFTSKLQGM
jgi:hypothetical protein